MRLSEKAIDELMAIYKEEFGADIHRDEAAEMGDRLLRLIRLLLRPLPDTATPPSRSKLDA